MKPSVAFVGTGRMGASMARRLKDCGYKITAVYDVHRPAAEELARELDSAAPDALAEVAAAAEIIFTVVTDDEAMREIFTSQGLLRSAQEKIFINCATVTPSMHVEIEAMAENAGAASLEACMASSIPQAREGTLYLMCAGKAAVYEKVKPVLSDLAAKIRWIGPAGEAGEVKALVNMVMNINTAGLAEGLGLGDALGLDLTMLREVFAETGAASRVLQTDGEDMHKREHACFFSAAHAAKDSGIALGLAELAGLKLPLAVAAKAQYDAMVKKGLGELDKSGVAELTFKGRGSLDR